MYLVAVKSLYSSLGDGQIVVLNDGTLSVEDVNLLNAHLTSEIVALKDIDCGGCPRGGTWERLLLIATYVKDHYVIQLDSDTLTLSDIPEVIGCVKSNRSFTLGTSMGRAIAPIEEICKQMKTFKSDHVQVLAEQSFGKLVGCDQLKYVRGCSGFAGFARYSVSHLQIEKFSKEMESILGKKWLNWGSEQVTSNFVIANSPQSHVLAYPTYANFTPEIPYEESKFLHFIGTNRFDKGIYVRKARRIVENLKSSNPLSHY